MPDILRDQAQRLLAERDGAGILRALLDAPLPAFDTELWDQMAKLGWCGVLISERDGGVDAGWPALAALLEQLGRAAAAVPFAPAIALVGEAISLAGSDAQKLRWLPSIAAGSIVAAVAFAEVGEVNIEGGRATGSLRAVAGSAFASMLMIVSGEATYICDDLSAAEVDPLPAIDPSRGTADLTLEGVEIERLECALHADSLRARAATANAFEAIGGAAACLDAACAYALERQAFGQQIGRFQGIKHMLADDYARIEVARGCAATALERLAVPGTEVAELLAAGAAAHLAATRAYEAAARNLVHVHGGIGVTWEADCHLHMRRGRALALELGSPHVWRDRLVQSWLDDQSSLQAA